MKATHLLYCLLPAAPLVLGGCSGSGIAWGEEAGGGGGQMAQGSAGANGATVRTGSISPGMIAATVAIITEHEASETQREVARQRGLAWTARRPAATRKHERYIAVDTAPDYRTAPDAEKSVMIFDSEALQVAGKSVYDLESPPPVGATARFDTYSARYVGSGL